MKTIRSSFVILFAILLLMPLRATAQTTLDNAAVESIITSYDEPGYKFMEKLGDGIWKVLYSRPGWEFGWEVVVTSTNPAPENSFIVIGTTVLATGKLTPQFMLKLLDENSFDTNLGSYSIFMEGDDYLVQYSVKIPQSLINKNVLIEGIGYVAGYSNKHVKDLEKTLGSVNLEGKTPGVEPKQQKPAEPQPSSTDKATTEKK